MLDIANLSDYQAIRKHSATHDVYNRLHSIARDMRFVDEVRKHYGGRLAVIRGYTAVVTALLYDMNIEIYFLFYSESPLWPLLL
jgi:hypothetical protein